MANRDDDSVSVIAYPDADGDGICDPGVTSIFCSGSVNAIDAALILQFVAGLLGSLPCPNGAVTNGDGSVNSIDGALILQFSAGLIGSF